MDTMLSAQDILLALQIAVAVMLIVILYHVLFIAVDLRKVMRRVEDITSQVEEVLLKPIAVADHVLQLIIDFVEQKYEEEHTSKKQKKVKKGKK